MAENEINGNAHSFNTHYSEIFGQWPWKNPQGENQSKKESFIIMLQEKSDIRLKSKSTYLNPTGCLVFRANAASISVPYLFSKTVPNQQQPQPRFLCRMRNILLSIFVPKTAENPYSTDSIKNLNVVVHTSKTMPGKY